MPKKVVQVVDVVDKKVRIKFEKQEMCSCCRLSYLCNHERETLLIDNNGFSLSEGDDVEISIDEGKSILANIILFLLPGVIFVSMLILFQKYGEVNSFFLAIGIVFIYYILTRVIFKKYENKFTIKILRKIKDE